MSKIENEERTPVLDPIDRVSEIIFGLIMALTFTGALSAATAGREEIRTMMFAALGCNLAWGLVDAVMYLIRTLTERARNLHPVAPCPQRLSPARRPRDHCRGSARPPGQHDQCRRSGRHAPAPRGFTGTAGPGAPRAGRLCRRTGRVPARCPRNLSGRDSFHLHHRNRTGDARLECGRAGDPVTPPVTCSVAMPAAFPGEPAW